jgi:hypothetical protein
LALVAFAVVGVFANRLEPPAVTPSVERGGYGAGEPVLGSRTPVSAFV